MKADRHSKTKFHLAGATAFLPLASLLLTSCTNIGRPLPTVSPSPAALSGSSSTDTATAGTVYKISSATFSAGTSGSTSTTGTSTVNINFNKTTSTGPITMSCNTANDTAVTAMPCLCQFSWQEINTSSGSSAPIPHLVQTKVSSIQNYMVVCPAPVYYNTEILNGTTIKISVVPSAANESAFSVPEYSYVKKASSTGSAFSDGTNAFDNILRYSCYEQFKRGMEVKNKTITIRDTSPANLGEARIVMASQFCVAGVSSSGSGEGCETIGTKQNSAQSYYYNLYNPSSRGVYNVESPRYICPRVKETLRGTSDSTGEEGGYWPLDATFSLAIARSTSFPLGVEAFSNLNNSSGDTSSKSIDCNGKETTAGDLVSRCLGFAAKVNSDGSCNYITDNYGNIHRMFRLRRYIALYPQIFDSNGKLVPSQTQARDMIYVLDRPVYSVNADPKNPFTMLGPKPCPFAYFDHKDVSGLTFASYQATNSPSWDNKNVDGIQFPNRDSKTENSCGAAMPIYNAASHEFSIATVLSTNTDARLNNLYVRPAKSWAPNYIEDTSFQACAPQASPKNIDPPLHFYKDVDGNMAWCAEAYPTQNPNITVLDKTNSGLVMPFTSHNVKNSASAECSHTSLTLPAGYPGACPAGKARHCDLTGTGGDNLQKTCDRTVINNGLAWGKFPLLASPFDVTEALKANLSVYGCLVSYDRGGSKAGKASPSGGCCGPSVTPGLGNDAHLEPNTSCFEPTY